VLTDVPGMGSCEWWMWRGVFYDFVRDAKDC